MLFARVERHDHLFERGIAGSFADAIDRDLYLTGSSPQPCKAVGCSQTQIVVAVDAENDLVDTGVCFKT